MIVLTMEGVIATIALNDPARRNALGLPMFDALDDAVQTIAKSNLVHIVLLRGEGKAFCAGFDLAAAVNNPPLMSHFIHRLSALNRSLRRTPQVVVAAVQGAAIAGGCALLSACDFVVVAADAELGYPVHRLGVSPAVTIPTLQQAIGSGPARALLMSGELISGIEARRLGLATHISPSAKTVLADAQNLCQSLAQKGPHALRMTKSWLNQLDGSLQDSHFDRPASASADLAADPDSHQLLTSWISARRST